MCLGNFFALNKKSYIFLQIPQISNGHLSFYTTQLIYSLSLSIFKAFLLWHGGMLKPDKKYPGIDMSPRRAGCQSRAHQQLPHWERCGSGWIHSPVRNSGSGVGSESSSWHWFSRGTVATTSPSGSCCSRPRAKLFCLEVNCREQGRAGGPGNCLGSSPSAHKPPQNTTLHQAFPLGIGDKDVYS